MLMVSRNRPTVTLSVVSHGQGELVGNLLADLTRFDPKIEFEVVLTLNIPERLPFLPRPYPFPLYVLENRDPQGFGTNHNRALERARGKYFGIINPDIELTEDPFSALIAALHDPQVGLAAPQVLSPEGDIEDSARRTITPGRLLRRSLARHSQRDYPTETEKLFPDWVAGMWMMVRADAFRHVGGFDESYFMYCEDADLCMRLREAGYQIVLVPRVRVVHAAQRASHRDLQHLRWHLGSLWRFCTRYPFYRYV